MITSLRVFALLFFSLFSLSLSREEGYTDNATSLILNIAAQYNIKGTCILPFRSLLLLFSLPVISLFSLFLFHPSRTSVNFHIEPYADRTAVSVKNDIQYIIDRYGSHPGFYRESISGKPLFYVLSLSLSLQFRLDLFCVFLYWKVYDSYLIRPSEWRQVLSPSGAHTIRNTPYVSFHTRTSISFMSFASLCVLCVARMSVRAQSNQ
jgi:hypothetical protein